MDQPSESADWTRYDELSRSMAEHRRLRHLLWDRIEELGKTHVNKWVGLGPDEVLHVADTLDEIVEMVDPGHEPERIAVIEYIWPDDHLEILAADWESVA